MIDIEVFNSFYKDNKQYIYRAFSYYQTEESDRYQESILVCLENQTIIEDYISGKEKVARSLFLTKLRESAKKYSITGKATVDNNTYERDKKALEAIFGGTKTETPSPEDEILNGIEFEWLKNDHGEDKITFLKDYLELGGKITAKKYKMSESNVRIVFHRLIKLEREKRGII